MGTNDFRTYRRRHVTRESGYHVCGETTGGECVILHAQKLIQDTNATVLEFKRNHITIPKLFGQKYGLLAFGGFLHSKLPVGIQYELSYISGNAEFCSLIPPTHAIEPGTWNNIGFHLKMAKSSINDVALSMTVSGDAGNAMEFLSFDFDGVNKDEFMDDSMEESFFQKTNMHIPTLYYLNTLLPIQTYLASNHKFVKGMPMVLKSCNRCGRYLPINICDEMRKLSFSLHCNRRPPCSHSSFSSYLIKNEDTLSPKDLSHFKIENGKVVSLHGHQLECTACKKFFVNKPLNPQRNPQQFKEDGLRRRAFERLVNELLHKNLVHFEFENLTEEHFSEHIWKKFGKKCFKCQKSLKLKEMQLDHTMPLAYLYRLDETATCLCAEHNSQKRDYFPIDFYSEDELERLSDITGLDLNTLKGKKPNPKVVKLLVKDIVWFFDEFLTQEQFQEVRDGIRTANKIVDSLARVLGGSINLVEEYRKAVGKEPESIT